MHRGPELAGRNLLSFVVDTYEIPTKGKDEREPEHGSPSNAPPTNLKSRYLETHPFHNTRQRTVRSEGHKALPSFVGTFFPRNDEPETYEYYCCSVLALLKPWRDLAELKESHPTWSAALAQFQHTMSKEEANIISNLQYYHSSGDAARRTAEERAAAGEGAVSYRAFGDDDDDDDNVGADDRGEREDDNESSMDVDFDEHDIRQLEDNDVPVREYLHG